MKAIINVNPEVLVDFLNNGHSSVFTFEDGGGRFKYDELEFQTNPAKIIFRLNKQEVACIDAREVSLQNGDTLTIDRLNGNLVIKVI